MADQATVRSQAKSQANPNGGARVAIDSPLTEGVFGNLTEFVNDCTTLGELQFQLALLDAKESAARAALPIGLAIAGSVLALASLPVLLLAFGQLLVQYTDLSVGWAYLIVAVLGLVIGGLLALLFGLRLGPAFVSFQRSREEFTRNLAWIKTVIAHSGRSPTNRRQVPR